MYIFIYVCVHARVCVVKMWSHTPKAAFYWDAPNDYKTTSYGTEHKLNHQTTARRQTANKAKDIRPLQQDQNSVLDLNTTPKRGQQIISNTVVKHKANTVHAQ